jgi:3-hydroxybutyryl-CoA dehydrogenase
MNFENIHTIGIVGAGTMGIGIAQVAALAEFEVIVFDVSHEAIKRAETKIIDALQKGVEKGKISEENSEKAKSRISFSNSLRELYCDIIIEAIIEDLNVKVELLKQLEHQNDFNCILASNTSSIPITRIASKLEKPENVIGMHFFNPAHIMKLVEVISGASTSKEVAETVYQLALKMGKTPVKVKDSPGFVVNRVARHYYVESLKILEENIADHKDIDRLLESYGFKMGPFKLMDLIGVDTNFSVTKTMFEAFHHDSKFRPSRIQEQKVDAGHWGKKSGKGFYDY